MYFLALIIVQNFEKKSSELIQNNEDLLRKSMDWFLYDNGLRHERVKIKIRWVNESFPTSTVKTIAICQGPKKA